jgi:hypothetical protein
MVNMRQFLGRAGCSKSCRRGGVMKSEAKALEGSCLMFTTGSPWMGHRGLRVLERLRVAVG